MKMTFAALGGCLVWLALLAQASTANEILEILEAPAVPVDDSPSPSDIVVREPELFANCGHEPADGDKGYACNCGPRWTVTLGAIYLSRSNPGSAALVADGFPPGSNTILDAGQFDFRTAWGFETSAIRHNAFGTAWDIEGRYFGVNNWNATVGPIDSISGSVVLYADPMGNDDVPSTMDAIYNSQLNSFELNGRRAWNSWLQFLAGVRHLELDERGLSISQDIGPGSNLATHQIGAVNQLWGFQTGLDARLLRRGRVELTSFARVGVYGNSMDNSVLITQSAGPTYASQASATGAAFVGELGFVGLYRLTDRWSLRATYQMLWLDSVAVASDQVAVSNPQAGTATVDRSGDVFYHGGFLGAQFNW